MPNTRHSSASSTMSRLSPAPENHQTSAPKIAASAARSPVLSSTAPNTEPPPRGRASAPSSMSSSTKTVTVNAPQNSCPVAINPTAPAIAPSVPTSVTASGVTPARARRATTGAQKRPTAARALTPSTSGPWGGPAVRAHRPLGGLLVGRRPRRGQQRPGLAQHLRQHAGQADDRHEVGVPAPARHGVLVQVVGDPGAGDRALVHPDVEAVRPGHRAHHPHGRLGEPAQLGDLGGGEVGVVGHVPVGHQHQVPGVVRVQVEDGEDGLTARDDQALLVVHLRDEAERAVVGACWLALPADVGHPVRRPEVVEDRCRPVVVAGDGDPGGLLRVGAHPATPLSGIMASAVGSVLARPATHPAIAVTASSTGTPLCWLPSRKRKETAPASASVAPAMSTKGTFCLLAVRIFFCIRSSESSISTRMPFSRSRSATSRRYGTCSSVTGMPTTCTGASQAGKAPA